MQHNLHKKSIRMNPITRRTFLEYLGVAVAGTGISGCAILSHGQEHVYPHAFPVVEPDAVKVDPVRLQNALQFIDSEVNAGSIPGAALVAIRNGRKFAEQYFGIYHDLDGTDKPYHPGVSSPLFSFSKGITATIAVMAHQEGLIDYDFPVSKYIPEFANNGKETVTLRHLLTHSAGIPSITGGPVYTEEQWNAFLTTVCNAPSEWPAGSRTAYHGVSAMFVVAEAIRRVLGMQPWDDICRTRLFEPLGTGPMGFDQPNLTLPAARIPAYFNSIDSFSLGGHPAGGCFGTADDMLRILHLIVGGGVWKGRTLLKNDAWQEMLRVQYAREIAAAETDGQVPAHETWGLGWLVRGNAKTCGAAHWFGFGDSQSPTLFGHAGVDTVYGVGDPVRALAFVFIMTDRPKDAEESTRLRREVSNRLQNAVLVV